MQEFIAKYLREVEDIASQIDKKEIEDVANYIIKTRQNKGRIFFFRGWR